MLVNTECLSQLLARSSEKCHDVACSTEPEQDMHVVPVLAEKSAQHIRKCYPEDQFKQLSVVATKVRQRVTADFTFSPLLSARTEYLGSSFGLGYSSNYRIIWLYWFLSAEGR